MTAAYAKEVWAACATLGFVSEDARKLKAGLDALPAEPDLAEVHRLNALARDVQQASVAWASERGLR